MLPSSTHNSPGLSSSSLWQMFMDMNFYERSFFPSHRAPKLVLPHFLHCQVVLAGTFMRCSDRAGLGQVECSSGILFASREGCFLDSLCRASWSQLPLPWKPCVFPAHHIADTQVCDTGFLPPTWLVDVFRVSGEICFPSQPQFSPPSHPLPHAPSVPPCHQLLLHQMTFFKMIEIPRRKGRPGL